MFHFDPNDYLCPSYLQKNTSPTYGFQYSFSKPINKGPVMKFNATSA